MIGEEFSGLGNNVLIYCSKVGRDLEYDLENKTFNVVRESELERMDDRLMATPPSEIIVPSEDGFYVMPTGFSASFTCELPDGAEAEALRDMMSRELPKEEFDIQIIPSLHRKLYVRLPRRLKKAMNHGGYYMRNTKYKRKSVALFNRISEVSPFTITKAKVDIDDKGEVLIIGRGVSKTNLIRQRRSKQQC